MSDYKIGDKVWLKGQQGNGWFGRPATSWVEKLYEGKIVGADGNQFIVKWLGGVDLIDPSSLLPRESKSWWRR